MREEIKSLTWSASWSVEGKEPTQCYGDDRWSLEQSHIRDEKGRATSQPPPLGGVPQESPGFNADLGQDA